MRGDAPHSQLFTSVRGSWSSARTISVYPCVDATYNGVRCPSPTVSILTLILGHLSRVSTTVKFPRLTAHHSSSLLLHKAGSGVVVVDLDDAVGNVVDVVGLEPKNTIPIPMIIATITITVINMAPIYWSLLEPVI